MYKTKLQEFCQKNSWVLPKYTTTKEGPDHIPSFKTVVLVNGIDYASTNLHKCSKDSQNEAAKVAFLSLTPPSSPGFSSSFTSSRIEQQCFGVQNKEAEGNPLNEVLENKHDKLLLHTMEGPHGDVPSLVQRSEMMMPELHLVYKSRLQGLAQRKKWSSLVYSHVQEGPPHMPRFKATVTIGDESFESPEFFSTLREAEHSAAKVALAFFPDGGAPDVEKSIPFKNLLQELAQKKGVLLPVYSTMKSGSSHLPTFQSTVQMDGETFSGKAATTKKEAEANAAEVAWFALKEQGKSSMGSMLTSAVHNVGHSGAKVAIASASDSDEETPVGNSIPLKNILQELVQKKGSLLPVYSTIKSGTSQLPTFQSSVQVDGETFSGKAAKTKKEAEANAAKVALSTLKERRLAISSTSSNLPLKEYDLYIEPSPTPDIEIEKHTIFIQSKEHTCISTGHSSEKSMPGSSHSDQEAAGSFSADMYSYLQQQFFGDSSFGEANKSSSKSPMGQSDDNTLSSSSLPLMNDSEHDLDMADISKGRNKVIVFPRWEGMKLPDGVTEQVRCEKWVAVTKTGSAHDSK